MIKDDSEKGLKMETIADTSLLKQKKYILKQIKVHSQSARNCYDYARPSSRLCFTTRITTIHDTWVNKKEIGL